MFYSTTKRTCNKASLCIAAVIIQLSLTNYAGSLFGVSWQAILIGLASFAVLYFGKWSVPKTILLSAGLGLILGGL